MRIAGKKVLVTGGAGFIGSGIVARLVECGATVRIFDNFSSGFQDNLTAVKDHVEIITGDILDRDAITRAARGMDIISHQAAQLEIIKCIEDPVADLRTNAEGTLNVFQAAKEAGVRRVVYASSACVYGQADRLPEDEQHPTRPNWPYGVSKLAAEHYANLFHAYYGIETIGLRYSIVFGPREWFGRVLTVFLKRVLNGEAPVIWGNGEAMRDFVYVGDVVDCHERCLEQDGLSNDVFNVSTGHGTTIRQLAELLVRLFQAPEPIFEQIAEGEFSKYIKDRQRLPAELKQMVLDNTKAKAHLAWDCRVSLVDGLMAEANWVRAHLERWQTMHY